MRLVFSQAGGVKRIRKKTDDIMYYIYNNNNNIYIHVPKVSTAARICTNIQILRIDVCPCTNIYTDTYMMCCCIKKININETVTHPRAGRTQTRERISWIYIIYTYACIMYTIIYIFVVVAALYVYVCDILLGPSWYIYVRRWHIIGSSRCTSPRPTKFINRRIKMEKRAMRIIL